MPRPEYPSDEKRRKQKPAVRVHLSTRNHPRFAAIWSDPWMRGMMVGLWQIAAERHANKTGDVVTLTLPDICWISGQRRSDVAVKSVERLANVAGYSVERRANVWDIRVRNFAKKQGVAPQSAEDDSATPHASESVSESESDLLSMFERAWGAFPKRAGGNPKGPAFEAWRARLKEGVSAEVLESAVGRYARFCEATGKIGTETVQQTATFFGPKKRGYAETWEIPNGNGRTNGRASSGQRATVGASAGDHGGWSDESGA